MIKQNNNGNKYAIMYNIMYNFNLIENYVKINYNFFSRFASFAPAIS